MSSFHIAREGRILMVGFGDPATGDLIVRDASQMLRELADRDELGGGGLVCINGRCSVPVAVLLGHSLAHIFSAVSVFDPKLNGYIVCISHDPVYPVGMVIPPHEVESPRSGQAS